MDDLPLPTLFEQAKHIYCSSLEEGIDVQVARKGCQILRKCEDMIRIIGMFSANETKEDISTTDLKYILVPFYLAELTEKAKNGERIEILKVSQEKLKNHLSFCELMELVPEEELESSLPGRLDDFAERRAKKIARFRRQRANESKLLEIKERKERRGRSTRAAALSAPIDKIVEETSDSDDEEEREMWLTVISLSICRAIELLEMMKKEEEMLQLIKEKKLQDGDEKSSEEQRTMAESRHRDAADRAQRSKPAKPITCAAFARDVLEGRAKASEAQGHSHDMCMPMVFGPASIVNQSMRTERERMVAKVFQPGHRLPTMSIEDAGVREMEMMKVWQERNSKLTAEANSEWHKVESVDVEDEEKEELRSREWDDWKDEHPRGAGNKKLTPCG